MQCRVTQQLLLESFETADLCISSKQTSELPLHRGSAKNKCVDVVDSNMLHALVCRIIMTGDHEFKLGPETFELSIFWTRSTLNASHVEREAQIACLLRTARVLWRRASPRRELAYSIPETVPSPRGLARRGGRRRAPGSVRVSQKAESTMHSRSSGGECQAETSLGSYVLPVVNSKTVDEYLL